MDVPQLKLLAGLVRGLLEQHSVPVGHSQSLDLIAALPGLRNWPEVNAFPDRVAACQLDSASTSRLAHRVRSKHGHEFSPEQLVAALSPPAVGREHASRPPQVWPSGPKPGVYITTSKTAINALLETYDEATDGELVYAEAAGNHWKSSIDLGEWGLSSNGLERVASGTLLVVGPLELNQQAWADSTNKLEWACIRAQNSGHRVAVLIDTPAPELMFKDVEVMVRSAAPEGDDGYLAFAGIVTDDGELAPRVPFVRPDAVRPSRPATAGPAELEQAVKAIPANVLPLLQQALERRNTGLLAFGTTLLEEHRAIGLVTAMLPLTESLGPVARIKPRNRGTPAKDMMVPELIKALPVLSSIESAYAHGYRRMVIDSGYTDVEVLLKFDDVLFITGTFGLETGEVFMGVCRSGGFNHVGKVLQQLVAVVGVGTIEGKGGTYCVSDVYLPGPHTPPASSEFEEVQDHLRASRTLRWEDELGPLLDSKRVTLTAVKEALRREQSLKDFLASRSRKADSTETR